MDGAIKKKSRSLSLRGQKLLTQSGTAGSRCPHGEKCHRNGPGEKLWAVQYSTNQEDFFRKFKWRTDGAIKKKSRSLSLRGQKLLTQSGTAGSRCPHGEKCHRNGPGEKLWAVQYSTNQDDFFRKFKWRKDGAIKKKIRSLSLRGQKLFTCENRPNFFAPTVLCQN